MKPRAPDGGKGGGGPEVEAQTSSSSTADAAEGYTSGMCSGMIHDEITEDLLVMLEVGG